MSYELLPKINRLIGDRILVEWEEGKTEFGKTGLVRPETHRATHYTGVVLRVGPWVSEEIKPGVRILFDQFSGVKGFEDEKHKRLAIIEEGRQAECFAIIPARDGNGKGPVIETHQNDGGYIPDY